jgi:phage recombination protein Bet
MSDLTKYEEILLKGDEVKRSFAANYVASLFKTHSCAQEDIIQFLHQAQLSGANPVLKEIYLIERNVKIKGEYGQDKWIKRGTVVYSYNFLLRVAAQTGEFDGYTENFEVKPFFDPVTGKLGKEELVCTVVVNRKNHGSYPYTSRWSEYAQDTTQWKSKPYIMLGKTALAGALRRAFPEAMGGVFLEEEIRDEDFKQDAIEADAEVKERKAELLAEKVEQQDERDAVIELIKERMGKITNGKTATEKGLALKEICGVNRFQDLSQKTLAELKAISEKALGILEEKAVRAAKKVKTVKDVTFKVEQ